MIKHHPTQALLKTYVNGELPASLSVAIAAHIELCPCCAEKVELLTEQSAHNAFSCDQYYDESMEFTDLIDLITDDDSTDFDTPIEAVNVTANNQTYNVPQVLRNLEHGKWLNLGKVSRARLDIEDGDLHSNLLHISPKGAVPTHTHKGFELTLILDGSFHDEMGHYVKGDFIWLNEEHTHNPMTEEGCLCLTVADSGLKFTQGLSKLFNPIADKMY